MEQSRVQISDIYNEVNTVSFRFWDQGNGDFRSILNKFLDPTDRPLELFRIWMFIRSTELGNFGHDRISIGLHRKRLLDAVFRFSLICRLRLFRGIGMYGWAQMLWSCSVFLRIYACIDVDLRMFWMRLWGFCRRCWIEVGFGKTS